MREIGAFDAKNKLSSLLDEVERGEEVVITRRGKPVARLVPDRPQPAGSQAHAAAARIRERAKKLRNGTFDWEEWRGLRDADRP